MIIKSIYVINLKRRKDKLIKIMKRLNEIDKDQSINITIFNAIDGTIIDSKYLEDNKCSLLKEWQDPFKKTNMTNGEIGCALSHYSIWEDMISKNYNHTLIVEDDAEFIDDFLNKLSNYEEPVDADLIYFGRKKLVDKERRYSRNLIKPEFSYWCVAYYLTFSGALKLTQSNYKMNLIPVDEFIPIVYGKRHPNIEDNSYISNFNYKLLTAYAFDPMLIKPIDEAFLNSDTEGSSININEDENIVYKGNKIEILNLNHNIRCDGYIRFKDSLNKYNLYPTNIGDENKSMMDILNKYFTLEVKDDVDTKYENNKIVIITDSSYTIFNSNINEIIDKFLSFNVRIALGTKIIGKDNEKYSTDEVFNYIDLQNIIGYYKDLKDLLKDGFDYLPQKIQNNKKIGIDNNTHIFYNLCNSENEFGIDIMKSRLMNNKKQTSPSIITVTPMILFNKLLYDNITNYLPLNYRATYGYNTQNDMSDGFDKKKILISININELNKESVESIVNMKYISKNITYLFHIDDESLTDKSSIDDFELLNLDNTETETDKDDKPKTKQKTKQKTKRKTNKKKTKKKNKSTEEDDEEITTSDPKETTSEENITISDLKEITSEKNITTSDLNITTTKDKLVDGKSNITTSDLNITTKDKLFGDKSNITKSFIIDLLSTKNKGAKIEIIYKSTKEKYLINSLNKFKDGKYDYLLLIDNEPVIKEKNMIKELIKRNKKIISPYSINQKEQKPNFHIMFGDNKPSPDFQKIVNGELKGCWNVPYIESIILMNNEYVSQIYNNPKFNLSEFKINDPNAIYYSLCNYNLSNNIFMYVDNMNLYANY